MVTTKKLPAMLSWRQPQASRRYFELVSEDRTLAALRFPKLTGTLAEAQADGTSYTFKRSGFLRPKVTIRKAPFDQDIGVVNMSRRGDGEVDMINGRRYVIRRPSVWSFRWQVFDESDGLMADVRSRSGLLRLEGKADITEKGALSADMLLLLVLEWYIMALIRRDSSTGASGA
jgi:hypothetical protein